MRVLHVLSSLNIGSGIANFAMSYYRKLVAQDIHFDFLLFGHAQNEHCEEVERLGGNSYFIAKPGLNVNRYKKQLKQFFKANKGKWDIVHIHEILIQKFVIKSAKKYGDVKKIITHAHVSDFVLPTYGVSKIKNACKMFAKRLRNKYLLHGIKKNSDYYFACSDDAGVALFGKKIVDDPNFYVIKNAIDVRQYDFDIEKRKQYRQDLGLQNKKVIIQVGRLSEQKNPIFSLDIINNLRVVDDGYVLLLVGDGERRKDVERKMEELNLSDHVILTGNRRDVPNLLLCADVFILPSLMEGLGIVLIEAQASGLPCIASTGVPQEANVTPYVKFLDLNRSDVWAETILHTELMRYATKDFLDKSGYNIDESAKRLKEIYSLLLQ